MFGQLLPNKNKNATVSYSDLALPQFGDLNSKQGTIQHQPQFSKNILSSLTTNQNAG
jgi:hypothetical protein